MLMKGEDGKATKEQARKRLCGDFGGLKLKVETTYPTALECVRLKRSFICCSESKDKDKHKKKTR